MVSSGFMLLYLANFLASRLNTLVKAQQRRCAGVTCRITACCYIPKCQFIKARPAFVLVWPHFQCSRSDFNSKDRSTDLIIRKVQLEPEVQVCMQFEYDKMSAFMIKTDIYTESIQLIFLVYQGYRQHNYFSLRS